VSRRAGTMVLTLGGRQRVDDGEKVRVSFDGSWIVPHLQPRGRVECCEFGRSGRLSTVNRYGDVKVHIARVNMFALKRNLAHIYREFADIREAIDVHRDKTSNLERSTAFDELDEHGVRQSHPSYCGVSDILFPRTSGLNYMSYRLRSTGNLLGAPNLYEYLRCQGAFFMIIYRFRWRPRVGAERSMKMKSEE
jgi:hypothetical protein